MPAFGAHLREFVEATVAGLHDSQDALFVSHGGLIETLALACLPAADALALGEGASFCDGVRLDAENRRFVAVTVFRAAQR